MEVEVSQCSDIWYLVAENNELWSNFKYLMYKLIFRNLLLILNGLIFRFNTKEYAQINGSKRCAYFQKGNIYISRCSAEISWICEKTAALVKIDDLD